MASRFHPGETLKEKLEEMEMSVKEFALRIGKPEQLVLSIIDGKMSVNAEWALLLEYSTGLSAEFWLTKQNNYDLACLRDVQSRYQEGLESWVNDLPVKEMCDNQWIASKDSVSERAGEALRFFGVSSESAWRDYYFGKSLKVAFRISLQGSINPYSLSAWLRQGEIQAGRIYLENSYSKKTLAQRMPEIAILLMHPGDEIMNDIQSFLGELGIKLIYTEPLSDVPIKGASRWIYGHPCIQLPNVQEEYGVFALTLLHEIGHIFLHGKKDVFLENVGFVSNNPEEHKRKEGEAESFAIKWRDRGLNY